MKNYKVGDRVWWTTYKILCEVADIKYSENDTPFEWIIDTPGFKGNRFDLFRIKEITQTADSMFEELGYRLILEDSRYIILNYFNYDNFIITELRIDKEDKEYKLSNFTRNNQVFVARISLQLHQAIHQKLIELGWVE